MSPEILPRPSLEYEKDSCSTSRSKNNKSSLENVVTDVESVPEQNENEQTLTNENSSKTRKDKVK